MSAGVAVKVFIEVPLNTVPAPRGAFGMGVYLLHFPRRVKRMAGQKNHRNQWPEKEVFIYPTLQRSFFLHIHFERR
jgi:hypothetical protein